MSGIVGDNFDQESGLVKSGAVGFKKVASDPGSPAVGEVWYNTTGNVFKFFDGSNTITVTTS